MALHCKPLVFTVLQVVAECTLKESAAINQILGRKVNLTNNIF